MPNYEYPRPAYTVDVAVLVPGKRVRILLIKRGNYPFKGFYALPGGFVDINENSLSAAKRELLEETSVEVNHIVPFKFLDDTGRDPRGRTLTMVYLAVVDIDECVVKAGDDAAEAKWFYIDELPSLAFDHGCVINEIDKFIKNGVEDKSLERLWKNFKI